MVAVYRGSPNDLKESALITGNHRRVASIVAALALLVGAPSAAVAKGWKLEIKNKFAGVGTAESTGRHCGRTKFGAWAFRGTLSLAGQTAQLRWKTAISQDGVRHPTSAVSVTGSAPESVKSQIQQTFSSLKYQYRSGAHPLVKITLPNGSTYATMAFRPRTTPRC
jgi:hypothetical protein